MSVKTPIIARIKDEIVQSPATRRDLYAQIEEKIGRPVVGYFTSRKQHAVIDDDDADALQGILQEIDLTNGLALVVSSYGGFGEAAERIINVCRNASGTGEFWAIVPSKAKSAATMICFGASKIYMSDNSELGAIDPQIILGDEETGSESYFSVVTLVKSYEKLFDEAVKTKGKLEPYLQQLNKYDQREIAHFKNAINLAEDIAIKCLRSGMMKGKSEAQIRKNIEVFLSPEKTKSHGRPIYAEEAKECKLLIEDVDGKSDLGKLIYELYIRGDAFVSNAASKTIESKDQAFAFRTEKRSR